MLAGNIHSTSVKKVTVLGPECTGKTDLSKYLAMHFRTEWVPEYARAFLDKLNRPYEKSDLTKIAHGQARMEDEWIQTANKVLICDTNLIVVKVWSDYKYGDCDPEILRALKSRHYDLLLLTNIDVPWEDDPQREHPEKRAYFWDVYRREASESNVATVEISGTREERRKKAISSIEKILV